MKKSILILAIMVLFTTLLTAQVDSTYQVLTTFKTHSKTTITNKSTTTVNKPMAVIVVEYEADIIVTIYDQGSGSFTTYICYMLDVFEDEMYIITFNNKHQLTIHGESIEIFSTDKNGVEKTILYK